MSDVNFTPTRGAYKELTPFRYWCQKVLPLVYDDSISYYELLCKVVNYLNITMEDVGTLNDDITAMYTAYDELQDFVNQYFTDLNVQTQIDNKLDRMAADGSLNALIDPVVTQVTINSVAGALPDVVEDQLPDVVEDQIDDVVAQQIGTEVEQQITGPVDAWLDANISASDTVLDSTLTLYNAAGRSNSIGILADNYGYYLGAAQRYGNFETYYWSVRNNVAVRDTDPSPTYNSIVITVSAGEKYTIKTSGVLPSDASVPRYIFTDNSNNVIELSSAADLGAIAKTLTVPAGATKLIINDKTFQGGEDILDTYLTTLVVKGELNSTAEIPALKTDLNYLIKELPLARSGRYGITVSGGAANVSNGDFVFGVVGTEVDTFIDECAENDIFIITGNSVGSSCRAWSFIAPFSDDDTYAGVVEMSGTGLTLDSYFVQAPPRTAYAIFSLAPGGKVWKLENNFHTENVVNKALGYSLNGYTVKQNLEWRQGYIPVAGTSAVPVSSGTRICTNVIGLPTSQNVKVFIEAPISYKWRLTFWNKGIATAASFIQTITNQGWQNNYFEYTPPAEAVIMALSIARTNDAEISVSDSDKINCYIVYDQYFEKTKSYSKKIVSILGDSISTYAGENAEQSGSYLVADGTYTYAGNMCRYPNATVANVNETYWKKFIDTMKLTLGINESWAGSKVSWDGVTESTNVGANKYIASQTRINHLGENGYPDYILINAGTNDIGTNVNVGTFNTESPVSYTDEQIANLPVATFADAYRTMLIRVQKKYPLAKIIVLLPNFTTSYYDPTKADRYLEIIKEACDYFGVSYIDMRTTGINMFNVGSYLYDGIHPNIQGMILLYYKIMESLS